MVWRALEDECHVFSRNSLASLELTTAYYGKAEGVKEYLIGKTASADTQESIRQAILKVKEVAEIIELETMYIGSEKLLVHLDINVQSENEKGLEQTVEKVKEHIRKEVPVVYSIQVETRGPSS